MSDQAPDKPYILIEFEAPFSAKFNVRYSQIISPEQLLMVAAYLDFRAKFVLNLHTSLELEKQANSDPKIAKLDDDKQAAKVLTGRS